MSHNIILDVIQTNIHFALKLRNHTEIQGINGELYRNNVQHNLIRVF